MSIVPQKPTPLASTNWVTGETTYDVSQMSPAQIWRSAVALAATKARNALPESSGRIDKAVDLVLTDQVELLDNGQAMVKSQSQQGGTSYTLTNGRCECVDYERAPQSFCKHRLARGILVRARELAKEFTAAPGSITLGPDDHGEVVQRCQDPAPAPAAVVTSTRGLDCAGDLEPEPLTVADLEPEPVPSTPAVTIPPQFLVEIQGRKFVTFHGLLAMSHQQGLLSLAARFISVTADLALAEATAMFHDGRTFTEAADSTPQNVNSRIKAHFARMALTRAKARCLRDALNITYVCAEELD